MRKTARLGLVAATFVACWLAPQLAAAQEYPTRPIRWIEPVPPGATTDILSRIIGQKMGEAWGQQVIVDNRSGGAFVIGTDIIAKAKKSKGKGKAKAKGQTKNDTMSDAPKGKAKGQSDTMVDTPKVEKKGMDKK